MKGDKKLLIIAVLLLLISASFTTYAIYRENTTAEGTIRAANWVVKLDKGVTATNLISETNVTFTAADLTCGSTRYGKNNTIAPGDTCSVTFTVDATGSEVDVVVEAELDDTNAVIPTGMTATATMSGGNGNISYATTGMTKTITLNVTWPGSVADSSSKDSTDLAKKGANLTIPVKITVRQAAPTN